MWKGEKLGPAPGMDSWRVHHHWIKTGGRPKAQEMQLRRDLVLLVSTLSRRLLPDGAGGLL